MNTQNNAERNVTKRIGGEPLSLEADLPHAAITLNHATCSFRELRMALTQGKCVKIHVEGETICTIEQLSDGRYGVIRQGETAERIYVPGSILVNNYKDSTHLVILPSQIITQPYDGALLGTDSSVQTPAPPWVLRVLPEHVLFKTQDGITTVERTKSSSLAAESVSASYQLEFNELELRARKILPGAGVRVGQNWFVQIAPSEIVVPKLAADEKVLCGKTEAALRMPDFVPPRVSVELTGNADGGFTLQDKTTQYSTLFLQGLNGHLKKLTQPIQVSGDLAKFGIEILHNSPLVPLARLVFRFAD